MTCSVGACAKQSAIKGMCKAHYYRVYRTGKTEKKQTGKFFHTNGYVMLTGKAGHPLAICKGQVLEHRYVYFETHGAGPFSCHWCSVIVTWLDLHIDHLDEIRSNNAPENLVASCGVCNTNRRKGGKAAGHKRNQQLIYKGSTYTLKQLAELSPVGWEALGQRLRYMSVEQAVELPRGKWPEDACSRRSAGIRFA